MSEFDNLEILEEWETYLKKLKNPNHQDKYGMSPLIYVCDKNHDDLAELIINSFDDINIDLKDENGNTAFMYACSNNNDKIIKLISSKFPNLDINDQNISGETALMKLRIIESTYELPLFIIDSFPNININLEDVSNGTMFSKCLSCCNSKLISVLYDKFDDLIIDEKRYSDLLNIGCRKNSYILIKIAFERTKERKISWSQHLTKETLVRMEEELESFDDFLQLNKDVLLKFNNKEVNEFVLSRII